MNHYATAFGQIELVVICPQSKSGYRELQCPVPRQCQGKKNRYTHQSCSVTSCRQVSSRPDASRECAHTLRNICAHRCSLVHESHVHPACDRTGGRQGGTDMLPSSTVVVSFAAAAHRGRPLPASFASSMTDPVRRRPVARRGANDTGRTPWRTLECRSPSRA